MAQQTISALSIARPLLEDLDQQPFSGRILGVFNRACNLIDDNKRIIALVLPEVGQGPFAILIPGRPGLFDRLALGQSAWANKHILAVDSWYVSLDQARIWEPKVVRADLPLTFSPLLQALTPYASWPSLDKDSPVGQIAHPAAARLSWAIATRQNEVLKPAVEQLAGLGSGLTPAGDDYLLGTLATLWFTRDTDLALPIVETALPKTNALSVAFLKAAASGEFVEPWHNLARHWSQHSGPGVEAAVEQIAQFGASSGTDALAGFSQTLLKLIG